jgi:dihydropteroate synthase
MKPFPVIRALEISHPVDLAAEARRAGLLAEDLARLRGGDSAAVGAPRSLIAATRLTPDGSAALLGAAARRGISALAAPGAACGATVYIAAPERELRDVLAEAGPVLGLPRLFGFPGSTAARGRADRAARPQSRELACRRGRLLLGERPLVMGVLNVTPDSFSDGGAFVRVEDAVARAWEMSRDGADLIDVGGESTRPGAAPVSAELEIDRVLPVVTELARGFPLPVSIDTYKSEVARRALEAGADLVNDVTGLRGDPALARVAAQWAVPLVVSHIRGTPRTMQESPRYADLLGEVAAELLDAAAAAHAAGVLADAIVLDPGVGFGKTAADNLEILRRLPELASLGAPLLVGVSRKSFIGKILDRPPAARLEGSLAAAEAARTGGAAMLRVHDVAETVRFLDVLGAVHGWRPRGGLDG